MGYYVGDIPAHDLVIEPARFTPNGEEPIDLTPFDTATAQLYRPDGTLDDGPGFAASIIGETIVVEWPGVSPFQQPGIHELRITLTHTVEDARERVPAVRLVADLEDGWHTLDSARDDWRDAPLFDAWLYECLYVAKDAVLEYAPKLEAGQRPPLNYRRGQLMQARNVWNAGKVDPASGGDGDDTFILRPYPLDWTIKQLLRPKKGMPVIA